MTPVEPVALVGMMGVGKSTIGRLLAREWDCPFDDSDAAVERRAGRSIPELFDERGEAGFRELEREVLRDLLVPGEPRVVSCGGGVVTDETSRAVLADRATVVWLTASIEVLGRRVGDGSTRPLLGDDPKASLADLIRQRSSQYEVVADHVVDTTDRRPNAVVRELDGLLG